MSHDTTPGDEGKKAKAFTSAVQMNMKINGTGNQEILKGIKNGNSGYYTETSSNDFIKIDLQDEFYVKAIKLCLWHFDDRFYTYECWVSKDSHNWNEIFTDYQAKCNDTIIIMDSIRYIRLKGKNDKNDYLHIINFKII